MLVEFQMFEVYHDSVIVAAECDCGRVLAEIDGMLLTHGDHGTRERPLVGMSLTHRPDFGVAAKERLAELRERMALLERLIAAATWAHEKPRKR